MHEYTPRGACQQVFEARDNEVLIVGPAGTGKSRACLEKLHAMALLNPGMKGLIVRKTATSLTSSALVTWEEEVLPGSRAAVSYFGGSAREPAQYRYANKSRVSIGGMDKASKIMSTQYDLIFVQEATELTENDWEALSTRLRSGKVSFQQLLADCNPNTETHWLKQRCDRGATRQLVSRHEDNPRLFDDDGRITPFGAEYIGRLDALTGVRYRRLRKGEWSSAEGVIYDEYDTAVHLIDRFDIPPEWPRWWAVDFGYTNPQVIQRWAQDPDGRLYLYREHYMTQRTVDRHAKDVLADLFPDEPKPQGIICDHDAEGQQVLRRELSMNTRNADKSVLAGIEAVMRRLRPAGDGKPRLFILRDSLAELDHTLRKAGRPTCTADEITGYVWDRRDGKQPKEEPVKENDHGCLVAGTLVRTIRGDVPIEEVAAGDRVWTRSGWRRVLGAGMTQEAAAVSYVVTEAGSLVGTGDHPVWTGEWTRLDALRYGMMVGCLSDTVDTPTTGNPTAHTSSGQLQTAPNIYTGESTRTFTDLSLTDTQSTTPTSTRRTTTLTTLSRSPNQNTRRSTRPNGKLRDHISRLAAWLGNVPPNGTAPKRAERGTPNTANEHGMTANRERLNATTAGIAIRLCRYMGRNGSARTPASLLGVVPPVSTTSPATANAAGSRSGATVTLPDGSVAARVLSVIPLDDRVPVFNLTVEGAAEFYANGLLVHNCDAMRYLVQSFEGRTEAKVRTAAGRTI